MRASTRWAKLQSWPPAPCYSDFLGLGFRVPQSPQGPPAAPAAPGGRRHPAAPPRARKAAGAAPADTRVAQARGKRRLKASTSWTKLQSWPPAPCPPAWRGHLRPLADRADVASAPARACTMSRLPGWVCPGSARRAGEARKPGSVQPATTPTQPGQPPDALQLRGCPGNAGASGVSRVQP